MLIVAPPQENVAQRKSYPISATGITKSHIYLQSQPHERSVVILRR